MYEMLILITVFIGIVAIMDRFTSPKENVWYPCTYCKTCDKVYTQAGINQSVYICSRCGNSTSIGYSFKVENGVIKTKKS